MKPLTLLAAAVLLLLSSSLSAQDKGYWRAASSNAKAITGDIAISDARLSINLVGFTLAQIRALTPAETSAAFDIDSSTGASGNLYRLNISASRRFQHHNTLCGSEDTQWMVTGVADGALHVDFFSGPNMPVLTLDALANSSDLCGSFTYAR